jgi:formylglycine-generating enzyme required for sulfatase activity
MGPEGRGKHHNAQHPVSIKDFAIGKFEVTQSQWLSIMNSNWSGFKAQNHPIDGISWDDAQEFVRRLSSITGKKYRLPSEAEWEYAARAGSGADYHFGYKVAELDRYAWFGGNSVGSTHPVGEKAPNSSGVYDIYGNVSEWTEDCWNEDYKGAPNDGTSWEKGDCELKVIRGGSWLDQAENAGSASRRAANKRTQNQSIGFRVSRSLP